MALELYTTVQASLAFSMLLSLALAVLVRRVWLVWVLLSANCALHLALDSIEIKPGNGVHFLAPLSWRMTSLEWVWPEHWAIMLVSAAGFVLMILLLLMNHNRMPAIHLVIEPARLVAAATLVAGYLSLPLVMLDAPAEANNRGIQAFLTPEDRAGMPFAADRDPIITRNGQALLVTRGQEIRLIGPQPLPESGTVSLRGRFIDDHTVRVTEIHVNNARFRDFLSATGLILILAFWVRSVLREHGSGRNGRRSRRS